MIGWKYLHFIDVTHDVFVNIVVHRGDMFGRSSECYASITGTVLGTPIRGRNTVEQSDLDITQNQLDIPCVKRLRKYTQEVRFECENIKFCVELTNNFPSISFGDGELIKSTHGGHHWTVDDLCSEFKGEIIIDGWRKNIVGFAYSDRQWGELGLQYYVSYWEWIHVVSPSLGAVAFTTKSKEGFSSTRVIELNKKSEVLSLNANTEFKPFLSSIRNLRLSGEYWLIENRKEPALRYRDEIYDKELFRYRRHRITASSETNIMHGVAETMSFSAC